MVRLFIAFSIETQWPAVWAQTLDQDGSDEVSSAAWECLLKRGAFSLCCCGRSSWPCRCPAQKREQQSLDAQAVVANLKNDARVIAQPNCGLGQLACWACFPFPVFVLFGRQKSFLNLTRSLLVFSCLFCFCFLIKFNVYPFYAWWISKFTFRSRGPNGS